MRSPHPATALSSDAGRQNGAISGYTGQSELLESLYERGIALPMIGPSLYGGDGMLMAGHHEPTAP